jgi:hypothetical protein
MKRNYVSPTAEKVTFNYSEQVVASGSKCGVDFSGYMDSSGSGCTCGYQEATNRE